MKTAILFLIFNRPRATEKVFQTIKNAKPPKLYIAADGPRKDRAGEREKCEEARQIATGVDWECEVKTLFRDENSGCGKAVSDAVSWFFQNEEEGIMLEYDIIPHPDFFPYCEELLEKYRHVDEVKFISGRNYLFGEKVNNDSYYFSAFNHVWGWAGWRKTWELYDFTLQNKREEDFEKAIRYYFDDINAIRFWKIMFKRMKYGIIDTWDYQFTISLWFNRALSIIPNTNLVQNIGFDEDATHTKKANPRETEYKGDSILPLKHPNQIVQNKAADTAHVLHYEKKHITAFDYYRKVFKLEIKMLLKRLLKFIA
jgi:hypothetical protein